MLLKANATQRNKFCKSIASFKSANFYSCALWTGVQLVKILELLSEKITHHLKLVILFWKEKLHNKSMHDAYVNLTRFLAG